ncbi:MAG: AAA family ATPase [Coriobacteriia bacterium]|nr:AAA family ATPase [Coriobacteriia bacterium]
MRLQRIEAVRYGRLTGATLGDLDAGLTVVLGPNEAGKSTYTSLVRHVLFGYPTAARKESGYFVSGDGRLGRLVFSDSEGSWVLERAEGPHGGALRTRALAGEEHPDLAVELTRGVSALAYRIVFGFGLDEMAAIEDQRATGDDVLSRLYAASAGLQVSPHEVRAALEKSAGEIFTPGGRKRELNTLISELRTVRAEERALRTRSEEFADDQERLAALRERLPVLREALERSRVGLTGLVVAVDRADERLSDIRDQEESLILLRQERKRMAEELDAIVIDEALLAAAPELDALLDEAPVHIESVRSLAAARDAVARASSRAGDAAVRSGLEHDALVGFGASHEDAVSIDEARDALQRLELQVESRTETLERESAVLARAQAAANRVLLPLGIVTDDPGDAIAERLSALEALESARVASSNGSSHGLDLPSLVMLVSGVVAIAAGVYLREWVTAGIGGVLVIAGLWFLLRSRAGVPVALGDDERSALRVLGLQPDAGTLDLSRMRRALENARTAVAALEAATATVAEAERDVSLARGALETRRTLWGSWLEERMLPAGLSPAAAATAITAAREARTARESEAELREDLARKSAAIDDYISRLRSAAKPLMDLPVPSGHDGLPALVNRIKEHLGSGRAHAARADELLREIRPADARIAAEEARLEKAQADIREILERFDLVEGGTLDDLRVRRSVAEREEAEAARAFESLVGDISGLEARLEQGAREQQGIELALTESGLVERVADVVDRYLVDACAARILADAQQRYERERQPEVVREAGRLFSTMTGGRYQSLTVPLDEGRIEAFDAHAAAHTSDLLSRGTAEQLYLSIRLGLIARLGDIGSALPVLMDDVLVNFDPERREGAAEAIAQLAERRQIIFFTCHPETAAVFSRMAGDHTLLEIDRICT